MPNILQVLGQATETVAAAFGVGNITLDGLSWQWGPYTKEQIAEAKKIAKQAGIRQATEQEQARAINVMELVEKSKTKTAEVLAGLTKNLDFELSTKSQPIDQSGKELDGKYEVINIYRKTHKGAKSLLGYGVLYKITPTDKAIKTADEAPIEDALRKFYSAGFAAAITTATVPPTTTQIGATPAVPAPAIQSPPVQTTEQRSAELQQKYGYEAGLATMIAANEVSPIADTALRGAANLAPYGSFQDVAANFGSYQNLLKYLGQGGQTKTVQRIDITDGVKTILQSTALAPVSPTGALVPKYVRYQGSPNIFDRNTGKWIDPSQAQKLGIFVAGAVQDILTPRPEIKTGQDYTIYNNLDLTVFPV